MKRLAAQIARELAAHKHCGVYEDDLSRAFPYPDKLRQVKIEHFATEHNWRLRFYHEGLCAIFDNDPAAKANCGQVSPRELVMRANHALEQSIKLILQRYLRCERIRERMASNHAPWN